MQQVDSGDRAALLACSQPPSAWMAGHAVAMSQGTSFTGQQERQTAARTVEIVCKGNGIASRAHKRCDLARAARNLLQALQASLCVRQCQAWAQPGIDAHRRHCICASSCCVPAQSALGCGCSRLRQSTHAQGSPSPRCRQSGPPGHQSACPAAGRPPARRAAWGPGAGPRRADAPPARCCRCGPQRRPSHPARPPGTLGQRMAVAPCVLPGALAGLGGSSWARQSARCWTACNSGPQLRAVPPMQLALARPCAHLRTAPVPGAAGRPWSGGRRWPAPAPR